MIKLASINKKLLVIFPLSLVCTALLTHRYVEASTVDIISTVEINSSTSNGPTLEDSDNYGASVANIGDLNGDGVEDIVVGASGDGPGSQALGAIYIHFMNTNGSIDSTVKIDSTTTNGPTLADGDAYGVSVANIGDLNGDGVNDIAVGATGDAEGGASRGAVHIHFMNTNGSIDSTVEINSSTTNGPTLINSDFYGASIANLGDLNGDTVNDIAVGAYGDDEGGTGRGTVHIHFMNTDGSIDSTVEINSSTTNGPTLNDSDAYGVSVANIGDLDGDTVDDIAVGASRDDGPGSNRGAVHIHFMNTNGSVDSTVEINGSTTNGPTLEDSDNYGTAIANIGDFDSDGVSDIAVGAAGDNNGGTNRGAIHIHFMNTNGSIDSTVEINDSTTNGPTLENSDLYGSSIASLGDLNGGGLTDIIVGALRDSGGGSNRGTVYIHFRDVGIEITATNTFNKDSSCRWDTPPETTWIVLEVTEEDNISGIMLTWTQYDADKITIKIDDGTGTFPWEISKTSNDGHEFLANVQPGQSIQISPVNHCSKGSFGEILSYTTHPYGWYNVSR